MKTLSPRPDLPMTDTEIWHTAWLMTQFFGDADEAHRAAVNHVHLVQGSPRGADAWQRIAGALKQIKTRHLECAVH
jgi:hypothetical protein